MDSEAVWQADAVALADRISALLTSMRSLEAEIGSLLVEIESRGVLELFGYRSVARLFEHLADVPKAAAETLVKRARALNSGRTLDGTPVPALAPATGAAASAGRLSTPMIDTIVGVMTQIPPEHRDEAERHLLSFASEAGHKQVAALGARIVAHLDPDGTEPDETEPSTPSRELSLRRKRSGFWELNGRFDDETGCRASALLDSLAQRRSGDEGPDLRSPLERYGDAFSDAIDLAFNSPDLPLQAGERAHVMIAVSLADLKSGLATTIPGDTGAKPASGPATSGSMPKASIGTAPLGRTGVTPTAGQAAFGESGAMPKVASGRAMLGNTGIAPKSGTGQARVGESWPLAKAAGGRAALGNSGTMPKPTAGQAAYSSTGTASKAGVGRAALGNTGPAPKPGVGRAALADLGTISAAEARIHACDCMLIPAVLGTTSEPLDLGRQRRLISTPLRRALYLRDRGCAFPGCHRPPRHCQGHHIRHWADGGPTELGNLVLMCAHHHRLLHRSGWQVRIAADGLPEFLPPAFLDKRRKPRRNNLHQPLPFAA
ncbi:hypothetical protein Amsp01_045070 [Amycolatopsis sp. NBRC 101858]|uniref:HNH endonuclease signature motif containing protein n=1 Tax=Amycolatopsis sp. NBRC 101858 TaxID=3032200 RepID=UPI0024A3D7B3|nr:DUF222 domain-containing protein [Amycolatopsis sp. NBRC 101858]GLY38483.1 hypothetical protein Amsp01_045070 [Amycolatopsis sp. NBRC 101858]